MIWKEVEIQLEEKKIRDRFVAKFRVLVFNYFRSEESLFSVIESHPWQISEYAKNYVDKKDSVFDFLKKETDENLFLYDRLKDFSYAKKNTASNVQDQKWCFDDIIWSDSLPPRDNSFYEKLTEKIETPKTMEKIEKKDTMEKINYIKNNKDIKIQKNVVKEIANHLGIQEWKK